MFHSLFGDETTTELENSLTRIVEINRWLIDVYLFYTNSFTCPNL